MKTAITPSRLVHFACYLLLVLLILGTALTVHAVPTPPVMTQAEFEKLQEQVRALDKDHALLGAKNDAQNNRISDLNLSATQQGNHIAAASNLTANVGNFFALLGGIIPLLLIVAGVFTYRKARSDAQRVLRRPLKRRGQTPVWPLRMRQSICSRKGSPRA